MSAGASALFAGISCGAAWWCAGRSVARTRLVRLTASGDASGVVTRPMLPAATAVVAAVAAALLATMLGTGALVVMAPGVLLAVARPLRAHAAAAAERRACSAAAPRVADLVAACVSVGAPPAEALDLVRVAIGDPVAARLAPVVSALRLGSDPVAAYLAGSGAPGDGSAGRGGPGPDAAGLSGPLRSARVWRRQLRAEPDDLLLGLVRAVTRAVVSGAPLVDAAVLVADEARRRRRWSAEAAARRAGVLAVGPLMVCYLPAFVLLGVVPLVLGVARSALGDLG